MSAPMQAVSTSAMFGLLAAVLGLALHLYWWVVLLLVAVGIVGGAVVGYREKPGRARDGGSDGGDAGVGGFGFEGSGGDCSSSDGGGGCD